MTWSEVARRPAREAWVLEVPWTAAWGLLALLLVVFLSASYLPMVDMPQHAAQVEVWRRLHDPASREASLFELNLGTPYLTAYVAARLLAAWVGAVPGWKVVVWAAAALHTVAFSRLVRQLGHPRWLAVLGPPLGLGYPFYFGFVSFAAAIPLVLFAMAAALSHRERPALRTGAVLALLLLLTLATHGFALGVAVMTTAPLLARGRGGLAARTWPLLVPAVVWAAWVAPAGSVRTIGATIWEPRVRELFGAPALWFAASSADRVAEVFGVVTLGVVAATLGAPSRSVERWVPLVLLVVGFCTFPRMLGGFGPLHPRFAAFFVPALLVAFESRPAPRAPGLGFFAAALSVAWLAVFGVRLAAFTRETQPVRDFIAAAPPGLRVRPVVFDRESEAFPGLPALIHLSAYYMVKKGGRQGYSFAMYPTSVIRYRPGVVPGMGGGAEWHPETFAAERELDDYDCVLVHGTAEQTTSLFGSRADDVELTFHEGAWWAYQVKARGPRSSMMDRADPSHAHVTAGTRSVTSPPRRCRTTSWIRRSDSTRCGRRGRSGRS